MRFRKNLFTVLAILALAWIIYGFTVTGSVASKQLNSQQAQDSTAYQAGTAIGATVSTTIFLCTGGPLFLIFALLAWRNGVGLMNKRRHEEMLAAIEKQKQ